MSSVGEIGQRLLGILRDAGAASPALVRGVRPVGLRAMIWSFLVRTDATMPRLAGTYASVAILALALGGGAWMGGSARDVAAVSARIVGLAADDVVITGQIETPESEILQALGVRETRSLVGVDVATARERILGLPWVASVSIRKLYPGRLLVGLTEKKAVALWQSGDVMAVIGRDGGVITRLASAEAATQHFPHLPLLVGQGAAQDAHEIVPLVADIPELDGRVSAFVRVAGRRWDLLLPNTQRIQLPERQLEAALSRLVELQRRYQVFERQVERIDLRQSDRTVLRQTDEAAAHRSRIVEERATRLHALERKKI